ncbi:hypothetical protein LJR164_000921 [Phenylobacterium sp. LjRoot164]|uniref:hypothetical protein n=1 Tax=unclassified Phenylobacterium TaxID=2640670 RepID=UPI003ECDDFB1
MRPRLRLTGLLLALATPAAAGPPFLTDDPEPTDTGHWELYAPALDAAGKGRDYDGALGVELNYGAAPDIQLTLGLPAAYVHDADGFRSGRGDLKLSVKYRFFHDEAAGFSAAVFPGITLPTAAHGLGAGRATALLPVWIQKDAGPWSVFGGGGYAVNPGAGARDYWTGGLAVSRQVSDALLIGAEIDRQGADTVDGAASTSLGLGAILNLKAPFRLLASAGPTFVDGGDAPGFHAFIALGLDF